MLGLGITRGLLLGLRERPFDYSCGWARIGRYSAALKSGSTMRAKSSVSMLRAARGSRCLAPLEYRPPASRSVGPRVWTQCVGTQAAQFVGAQCCVGLEAACPYWRRLVVCDAVPAFTHSLSASSSVLLGAGIGVVVGFVARHPAHSGQDFACLAVSG
jgi:hypothetical protein